MVSALSAFRFDSLIYRKSENLTESLGDQYAINSFCNTMLRSLNAQVNKNSLTKYEKGTACSATEEVIGSAAACTALPNLI